MVPVYTGTTEGGFTDSEQLRLYIWFDSLKGAGRVVDPAPWKA